MATPKQIRRRGRWSLIVGTLLVTGILSAIAFGGDVITVDGDVVDTTQTTPVDLGTVVPGAVIPETARFTLTCNGKQHVDQTETVTLTFSLAQSTVPAGGSLSATNGSVGPIPASWPDDTTGAGSTNCAATPETLSSSGAGDSSVTITAPTTPGPYTFVVRYNFSIAGEVGGDANPDVQGSNVLVTYNLTVSSPTVNQPPNVEAGGPYSGGEGSNIALNGASASDSDGSVTSVLWTIDSSSVGTGSCSLTNATSLTTATINCTDNGTATVKLTATDDDGATNSDTAGVTINNVAPTATLGNNGPVNEGSAATISFSGQSDPSSVDTTSGFHYAYSCTNGSLATATYANTAANSASTSCTFDDNGSYTVRARIIDKDDGYTEYTTSVTVNNVAPTGTLGNNGPVNEGSPATISFSGQSDPSNADTLAGFHYAYSCTNGSLATATYANTAANSSSTSCTFDDNGSYTVRARIIDKDDGYTEYTTSVTVNNVAPTGTLGNNGPVNEGSAATISFSGQSDPSNADTLAGFHYAYSCTNGSLATATYANTAANSSSTSCTYFDNGSYTVKARIIDKDDGYTEYTTSVTVNNVPPTITSASFGGTAVNCGANNATLTVNFTDPGTLDTWTASVDWDNDGTFESTGNSITSGGTLTHTYATAGSHTAAVKVIDDDGGVSNTATATIVVNYNMSAILQPVNDTRNGQQPSMFKYGSTIPVKIEVTDCDGSHPSNLDIRVTWTISSSDPPPVATDEVTSTSAADTGNKMRFSDPIYIFNLASKSLSNDPSVTVRIDVKITSTGQYTWAFLGLKK